MVELSQQSLASAAGSRAGSKQIACGTLGYLLGSWNDSLRQHLCIQGLPNGNLLEDVDIAAGEQLMADFYG